MKRKSRILIWLQYGVLGAAILYFGRDLFVPLAFALLISFVLYPSCIWMERKGLSRMGAIVINISLLGLLMAGLLALLTKQFVDFAHEWPALQTRIEQSFIQLGHTLAALGIDAEQQRQLMNQVSRETTSGVMAAVNRTISVSIFSAVMILIIPIYAVLILYYRKLWVTVLYQMFPKQNHDNIKQIISLTIKTYYNFIKGMGLVYLAVGILNSIGLLLLGIPHAILFGFIAAVLTFIPYVGIMVGALLPVTVAWATYDSAWYPLGVIGIFAFVQYLEANVIFPIAVSNRLNVNTLVMLIAIFAGGILWGLSGMILFVPFVGILKLIADHNPQLKTLSLLLGTTTTESLK